MFITPDYTDLFNFKELFSLSICVYLRSSAVYFFNRNDKRLEEKHCFVSMSGGYTEGRRKATPDTTKKSYNSIVIDPVIPPP